MACTYLVCSHAKPPPRPAALFSPCSCIDGDRGDERGAVGVLIAHGGAERAVAAAVGAGIAAAGGGGRPELPRAAYARAGGGDRGAAPQARADRAGGADGGAGVLRPP